MSSIHAGPLPQAGEDDEHHVGPLRAAAAEGEHHAGPLPQTEIVQTQRQRQQRKSWREKRWERRRRRRFMEEVLGWILVPIIVISVYWAAKSGLNAMGTNFTTLFQGIRTAISASKG